MDRMFHGSSALAASSLWSIDTLVSRNHDPGGYIAIDNFRAVIAASREINRVLTGSGHRTHEVRYYTQFPDSSP